MATPTQRLDSATGRLSGGLSLAVSRKRSVYARQAGRISPTALVGLVARRRDGLTRRSEALEARIARRRDLWHAGFDKWASRLAPSLARLVTQAAARITDQRKSLRMTATRLDQAPAQRLSDLTRRLEALERTRQILGYAQTLRRGFAVVRGDGTVVTSQAAAEKAQVLEVEFHDGRITLSGRAGGRKATSTKTPDQGSLF